MAQSSRADTKDDSLLSFKEGKLNFQLEVYFISN